MRTLAKFILHIGIYAAVVGLTLFGAPRFLSWYLGTQYPMAAITSGSMWPALHTGDLVFIEDAGRENLKVGDIIVWKNSEGFTIHRIVRLEGDELVTKGDANFNEDEPVRYEDVVGRTFTVFGRLARIPYLGMITVYAHQR